MFVVMVVCVGSIDSYVWMFFLDFFQRNDYFKIQFFQCYKVSRWIRFISSVSFGFFFVCVFRVCTGVRYQSIWLFSFGIDYSFQIVVLIKFQKQGSFIVYFISRGKLKVLAFFVVFSFVDFGVGGFLLVITFTVILRYRLCLR